MPTTIERPAATMPRRRRTLGTALGAGLALAALAPLATATEDGRRADVTVVNDGRHDVGVLLVRPGGSVLPLAHVRAGTTRVVEEVLHAGGDLELVWLVDGREAARSSVPRDDEAIVPDLPGR